MTRDPYHCLWFAGQNKPLIRIVTYTASSPYLEKTWSWSFNDHCLDFCMWKWSQQICSSNKYIKKKRDKLGSWWKNEYLVRLTFSRLKVNMVLDAHLDRLGLVVDNVKQLIFIFTDMAWYGVCPIYTVWKSNTRFSGSWSLVTGRAVCLDEVVMINSDLAFGLLTLKVSLLQMSGSGNVQIGGLEYHCFVTCKKC